MERCLAKSNTDLSVAIGLCVYLRRRLQERQEQVRHHERDRLEPETGKRRPRRQKWSRRLERELELQERARRMLRAFLDGLAERFNGEWGVHGARLASEPASGRDDALRWDAVSLPLLQGMEE
jgi:hypothetical protein